MENSASLHQILMKRRLSVPETVMRRHNLQDVALRQQQVDSVVTKMSPTSNPENAINDRRPCETTSSTVYVRSWVDDDDDDEDDPKLVTSSSKKSTTKSRKRKSFRLLRKSSSSYCQYRYTMSKFSRQILGRRGSKSRDSPQLSQNPIEPATSENSDYTYSSEYSNGRPSNVRSEAHQQSHRNLNPIGRRLPEIREFPACPQRMVELMPDGSEESVKESSNTTNCANALQNRRTDFPLIVQSESVFHHPSQTGCSTRETHSISIEILPSCSESRYSQTNSYFKTAVRVDREVRGGGRSSESQFNCDSAVSDGKGDGQKGSQKQQDVRAVNEVEAGREGVYRGLKNLQKPAAELKSDDWTSDLRPTRVKLVDEMKTTSVLATDYEGPRCGSIKSNSDNEDCAVPMSVLDCLSKRNGGQQLNIQVSVGKIGPLENVLLTPGKKGTDALPPCSNGVQKPIIDKHECDTKMALNYLFEKLGDAYPKPQKHFLLKEPTFVDYRSQAPFGQYYSGLPKLSDTPVSLTYKCDVLPAKQLPGARKAACSPYLPEAATLVTKRLDDGEPSDSDISIADSLEDLQQSRTRITKDRIEFDPPPSNRYRKYDERLARGDVDKLVRALEEKKNTPSERAVVNGISYFLPFSNVVDSGEDGQNVRQEIVDQHAPQLPNTLLEKLNRRSNSISKHAYCLGACKNREFVHKQIQTCFNAQESLRRKRRPRITEPTLDRRIAKILMTGLEMQEGPNAELLGPNKPVAAESASESHSRGSSGGQSMINKVEGIYWFRYSTDGAEKKDAFKDTPNSSKYRYQKNKLKYFEELKVRKQRDDTRASRDNDFQSSDPEMRKLLASKERRSPPKAKNGKPKVFGSRFHQKFEAIPEEIASSTSERCDINRNCVEKKDKYARGPKSEPDDEVKNCEDEPDTSESNLEARVDGNSNRVEPGGITFNGNRDCVYCKKTFYKFKPNTAPVVGNDNGNYVKLSDKLNAASGAKPINGEDDEECKVESPALGLQDAAGDCDDDSGGLTEQMSTKCDTDLRNADQQSPSSSDTGHVSNSPEKCENRNDAEIALDESSIADEAAASEIEDKYESTKIAETREEEFRKRRDLLYSGNAKEELITLSRGWINFYLLKAGPVGADDCSNLVEDVERDESAGTAEDAQQYMLHIQAVPQVQRTRTLPDLSQLLETLPPNGLESRRRNVPSKTNSTSPDIREECTKTPQPSHRVNNFSHLRDEYENTRRDTVAACDKNSPAQPKLSSIRLDDAETDGRVRGDGLQPLYQNAAPADAEPICEANKLEPEIASRSRNGEMATTSSFWSESTSIMNVRSTASSSATSSSNCSTSSASNEIGAFAVQTDTVIEDGGRNVRNTRSRKTQYNLRPQTYHSTAGQDCYRRSASVEGNRKSANKKNSTGMVDIEMRLLVKNRGCQDDNGNRAHSWKFTLTSDDSSNANKNERISKNRYAFCTPNRNSSHQHQAHSVKLSGCSETTSTSTSTCSSNEKKRNKEAKLNAKCALTSYPLRSNDNLTVTGSSIVPESKPKPPTMSERDITRTRLSKYAININKL